MKRTFLSLILILCLLLCSCAPAISGAPESMSPSSEPSTTPAQPTEPPVQPSDTPATEVPTFPMGDTGAVTNGALRSLPLNIGTYCNAYLWGETVLLHNSQQFTFQLRSLQDGRILATCKAGADSITVTDQWLIYYAFTQKQIVFRDKNLEVVKTVDVDVSDDVSEVLLSQDGSKAFYHDYPSNTIIELDIQTGEKREIPVDGAPIMTLSGFAFNTLYYWGKADHQDYYAFVELSSGEYLGKDTQMTKLQTWDNGYYLCRAGADKTEHRIVIENTERSVEPQKHENLYCNTWALPQVNGLFALHSSPESSTVILELYDLTTGECTNSLTANLGQPYQQCAEAFADPSGEYIWLCMKVGTPDNCQMVLYRWDFQANAMTE